MTGDAVDADLAFHRALLAATHNELLDRMEVVLETGLADRDRLVHGAAQARRPGPRHRRCSTPCATATRTAADAADAAHCWRRRRWTIEKARSVLPVGEQP